MPADEVIREETAIDRLFDEIRDEVADDETYERASPYGFEVEWEGEDDEQGEDAEEDDDEYLQNAAVERLMENIGDYPNQEVAVHKWASRDEFRASADWSNQVHRKGRTWLAATRQAFHTASPKFL